MAVPPSAGQARLPTHTHVTLALICAPVPAPSLRSPSHLQCRSAVSQMAPPPLKPCSSSPAASTTTPACQLVRGCDRDGGGAMCGAALCRGGVAFFSHSTYRDPPPTPPHTHTHTLHHTTCPTALPCPACSPLQRLWPRGSHVLRAGQRAVCWGGCSRRCRAGMPAVWLP